ncbi:MAG: DUF2339 domain-containing protein [Gemmatimonadota bacterium]
MKTLAFGLLLAVLLFLFVTEPITAAAIGLLAFLAYGEITALQGRIRLLEHDAQPIPVAAPERAPEAASEPLAPMATRLIAAPAQISPSAIRAPISEPRQTAWDRWRSRSFGELEELIAGRLLAVVGGLALFLGGVFFLGLAFSRGWIGPELRVAIGLLAGIGLFGLGGWLLRGPRQIVAHVLAAVGIGVFSLALFAATRLHGFFAPEFGVAAALVAAAAAAALAIRYDAEIIAVFGLVAVLAAPPVMGASASLLTLAFIGTALAGTTAIALFRSWRWLPSLAFVLSVPQLASYLYGDRPLAIGLAALGGYWLLNATAAAGDELLVRRNRLAASSATLLLATAAVIVVGGFEILEGDLERWRGLFLVVVAAVHLALAAAFLVRESDRHPFGMLAAGTGIAAVTMAVPIQLGAEWVPLAWASEAVALAWIAVERRHRFSGIAAAVLGILAAAHVLLVEYPVGALAEPATDGALPFVNASGMALGFVVLAAALAAWLVRGHRPWRTAVIAAAATLAAIATPHELAGTAEALALTAIGAGVVITQRRLLGVPFRLPARVTWTAYADRALYAAAGVTGILLAAAFFEALPVSEVVDGLASSDIPAGIPFINERSTVAVIVAGGALVVALACEGRWTAAGILTAAYAMAHLLPIELGGALAVAGWAVIAAALAVGAVAIGPWLGWGARALALAAGLEALGVVAPVERLWVSASAPDVTPILNGAILATLAGAGMLAARSLLPPSDPERRWAGFAAGAVAMYAASIGLVDLFQVRIGGGIAVEELAKQAQVALSVLWALVGAVLTVVGLRVSRAPLRLAGLALLGVVTLKVFVVDLAALDIAYRGLSFVALGILLLAAAYLYGRMQPGTSRNP